MTKRYSSRSVFNLLLLGILLAGGYLRARAALKYPFWLDEANIFLNSRFYPLQDLLLLNYFDTAHPPGFPVFMHFWQNLGTSVFFARIPSLIFSILTLYLVYLIGKELINTRFGLICTTIFAFSNFLISLSWQAKSYPFVMFFTLVSLLIYLKNINSITKALLFIFVNLLGFFFDYGFIWYFLSLLLFELLGILKHLKFIKEYIKLNRIKLLSSVSFVLLMLLWLPIFISRFSQAMYLEGYLMKSSLRELLIRMVFSFVGILKSLPATTYSVIIFMIVGLVLGLYRLNDQNKQFIIMQFISIIFSLSISFSFSILYGPIIVPRNLYIVCFGLLFGWAYFIYFANKILSSGINKRRDLTALVLIGFWIGINLFSFNDMSHSNSDIRNWEKVGRLIEEFNLKNPRLNLLLDTHYRSFTPLRYYLLGFNKKAKKTKSKIDFLYYHKDVLDYISKKDKLASKISIWLFNREKDRKSLNALAKNINCDKKEEFIIENMLIYLCSS